MKTTASILTLLGILALGTVTLPQAQDERSIDEDSEDGETVFVNLDFSADTAVKAARYGKPSPIA